MAKELPYFKFEPNQWENGNIQICDRHDKGLFMDLCSMYWSRVGDLPLKLALQKLCGGNANAFDTLIEEEIFTVSNGMICIDFLNEQLQEFDDLGEKNRKNALSGWEKRRNKKDKADKSGGNAVALNSQCEIDAIREEKRREKDIKESIPFSVFWEKYDKKSGNKKNSENRWKKINIKTQERIIKHLDDYIRSTPDKKFRKNPEVYLNQEHWESEIEQNNLFQKSRITWG